MILQYSNDICSYTNSIIYDDEVFKQIIKNYTPFTVWNENKEFLESIITVLVNYSPISINIIDFWNKDLHNQIIIPDYKNDLNLPPIEVIDPFEFKEGIIEQDEYGLGFEDENQEGGELISYGQESIYIPGSLFNTNCPGESKKRFYINSIIGVQDKLAYMYMNDIYMTTKKAKEDYILRNELKKNLEEFNIDTKLFNNINSLFTENKYITNKEFLEKKGTKLAIKYAGKNAYDSQIQGTENIYTDYYLKIDEKEPFYYTIESTLFDIVFERFVKPLSHPIGMIYEYNMSKSSSLANITEYPMNKISYVLDSLNPLSKIYIICNCTEENKGSNIPPNCDQEYLVPSNELVPANNLVPAWGYLSNTINNINISSNPIDCSKESSYIIATNNGRNIWDPIKCDRNILKDIKTGIIRNGEEFEGAHYTKYIFNNENYLISYKNPNIAIENNIIRYYRYDLHNDEFTLTQEWKLQEHCKIIADGVIRINNSIIQEEFTISRESDVNNLSGEFQFLNINENTPPEVPAPSGYYEGFLGRDAYSGGKLISININNTNTINKNDILNKLKKEKI